MHNGCFSGWLKLCLLPLRYYLPTSGYVGKYKMLLSNNVAFHIHILINSSQSHEFPTSTSISHSLTLFHIQHTVNGPESPSCLSLLFCAIQVDNNILITLPDFCAQITLCSLCRLGPQSMGWQHPCLQWAFSPQASVEIPLQTYIQVCGSKCHQIDT